MRLAIAYDISENRTRTRVYKILEKYGAWKQYSVFELEINEIQKLKLEDEIKSQINKGDRVRIYQLCNRCVRNIRDLGDKNPERKSNVV
ncbi:CRISPR-associated endonuclease Cas2 [Methanohalophilus sp. DAL1]|jgi:CRISPR-associated protein Cas2|uniref:CRISPR-associated endonuclease Cas2 n=1 Tax=Methanohalophilus sp. DAL1 TaxID=1864608 RepID=UPI000817829F|nr:CRISPR-associated endonuclease Cas2 [Methanohalophilus sp. DAL1]OBZ35411.1 MAG: CRISPR-associated endonuclease Cas2 [Methanohalophilus sp. DAL1]